LDWESQLKCQPFLPAALFLHGWGQN
jgi:hypothetical protein